CLALREKVRNDSIVFNPTYSIYSPFPPRNLFAPRYDIFFNVSNTSDFNIVVSSYSLLLLSLS
ncbi:MAG TPA: hypothetical protein PLV00_08510, partial [Caldisericia bacterium]|nr:hypothetical protein [Caldisericia bacterium]